MEQRQRIADGAAWEDIVGYARGVRVGNHLFIAGTTGLPADAELPAGDAYAQSRRALERIQQALTRLGAELRHVVRTRMFVTNIDHWEAIGRAHHEFFGLHRPATTMVEVQRLIDPRMLVEIEAEAIIED